MWPRHRSVLLEQQQQPQPQQPCGATTRTAPAASASRRRPAVALPLVIFCCCVLTSSLLITGMSSLHFPLPLSSPLLLLSGEPTDALRSTSLGSVLPIATAHFPLPPPHSPFPLPFRPVQSQRCGKCPEARSFGEVIACAGLHTTRLPVYRSSSSPPFDA